MATAKDVMTVALSHLGVKESPANSNNVIFNTAYYGHAVNGSWYPWCCVYVWYCFQEADASDLFYDGKKVAYCPYVATWAKNHGLVVDKNSGQYGDIVLFDWGKDGVADHIGFIEKKNSNGSYTTIEGNTSYSNDSNGGEVMRRTRYTSQMQMIIRPKYSEDDMTKDEIQQMIDASIEAAIAKYNSTPSNWAKSIWERATKRGLVDGSRPKGLVTREQLAAVGLKIIDILTEDDGK